MKKIICVVISVFMMVSLSGCQKMARNFGGNITIKLEPNTKLE